MLSFAAKSRLLRYYRGGGSGLFYLINLLINCYLLRQNRDCRGIIAAAAAVKCYSIQLVNQMLSFAAKSRLSRYYRGGGSGNMSLYSTC